MILGKLKTLSREVTRGKVAKFAKKTGGGQKNAKGPHLVRGHLVTRGKTVLKEKKDNGNKLGLRGRLTSNSIIKKGKTPLRKQSVKHKTK